MFFNNFSPLLGKNEPNAILHANNDEDQPEGGRNTPVSEEPHQHSNQHHRKQVVYLY